MRPGDVTYGASVCVNPSDEKRLALIVTRDVKAGVCGPCDTYHNPTSLAEAERYLVDQGYIVGPWAFVKAYDGLRLAATLERASSRLVALYCEGEEEYHDARKDESGVCPACTAPPEVL